MPDPTTIHDLGAHELAAASEHATDAGLARLDELREVLRESVRPVPGAAGLWVVASPIGLRALYTTARIEHVIACAASRVAHDTSGRRVKDTFWGEGEGWLAVAPAGSRLPTYRLGCKTLVEALAIYGLECHAPACAMALGLGARA